MARIFIYTGTYLMEIPETDANVDDNEIFRKASILEKDVDNKEGRFQWMSGAYEIYDTNFDNIGRCSICGVWVTDCEAENKVRGVCNGAKVGGELFCDEHLPINHQWRF